MKALSQVFDAKIRAALLECHRLGYYPHDFESMLANSTAVQLAERLVASGEIQTGLKRLAKMGRLDLSVEALMLEPEFEALFKLPLRDAARWHLEQAKAAR